MPLLYAANTVNYGKPFKLNTAEALAASLYITGYKEDAIKIMSKFNYGPEFLKLNQDLLESYCNCKSESEVRNLSESYLAEIEVIKEEKLKQKEIRVSSRLGGYMDDMDLPPMDSDDEYYKYEDDNTQDFHTNDNEKELNEK